MICVSREAKGAGYEEEMGVSGREGEGWSRR